jgi:hypothetical protein
VFSSRLLKRPQVEHKRAIALAGWCFAGGLIDPYSPLLCAPLLALLQALLMQLPFLLSAMLPRWCAGCYTSGRRAVTGDHRDHERNTNPDAVVQHDPHAGNPA